MLLGISLPINRYYITYTCTAGIIKMKLVIKTSQQNQSEIRLALGGTIWDHLEETLCV